MSFPDVGRGTRRKKAMMIMIRDRLKGFEIRQLIREEIRNRKRSGTRPFYLSGQQLGMFE